ncbi:MAG: ATP-binding protein [Planctomycetia bacterium]|nr:ATP-binding protein [Planctomycetia bacterium]
MSRRLLGPTGGPLVFFLVAALVFAGLGWVTVAALRVEEAQREASARAEHEANLRVAVRQLDTRMLATLAVEDNRPFYHYHSADPLSGSTAGPTPLLAAPLPDWMKIHIQLDPVTGWESPQVLSPEAADRVARAWPELPLRNNTAERAGALKAIQGKHPSVGTWELFATRDLAIPDSSLPFAAPFILDPAQPVSDPITPAVPITTPKPPPTGTNPISELPPIVTPPEIPAKDILGFWNSDPMRSEGVADKSPTGPKKEAPSPQPGVQAQQPVAPGGRMGFGQSPGERGWTDLNNRAQTIKRAVQEAKNAGLDFPMYGKPFPQNPNQISPGGDGKNPGNQPGSQPTIPPGGQPPTTPGPVAPSVPGAPSVPLPGPGAGPGPGDKGKGEVGKADGKTKGAAPTAKPGIPIDPNFSKSPKEAEKSKAEKRNEALNKLQNEQFRGTLTEHLATLGLGIDRLRCVDDLQLGDDTKRRLNAALDPGPIALFVSAASAISTSAANVPAEPVPPAEERPVPTLPGANVLTPPVNIHIGSMRPQWITAADGTETLVLVRAARIDNKTIYQGVILDWAKLEVVLKEEVKDLFPDARLVPVKDPADVSPDRAMTALPVQLDPGTDSTPPPAGWTPLRIGLVLAWAAAIIAFAAVGFSGWSLIDLAERRIRFVSAVTHELRTPLTSLRLYLDLLMSGMIHDEAKRQEYLNTLATESDRLHRLIDNVLDFAKLEKRAKNGDMKPVKVGELLAQLKQTWSDRVAADGKELVVISTLPAETEVCTDPAMVYQIVGNLIDNARKYTRDAEDKRIWLWAKPGGSNCVVFEVEDRGPGVPASERKAIFKPFRRGEHADAKAGGAGLGLALAKQWAEVLGGTVAFRPAAGAPGACFRLELPTK